MNMPSHLVVLSYRDMQHPEAGGAEVIMHEVFRRLRRHVPRITFVTSGFPDGEPRATYDDLDIHRVGNKFNFNFAGPAHVKRLAREHPVDAVIEDINKIPFFSPLVLRGIPVVGVVPHLFGTTVFREAPWPIAAYVYLYERLIPLVYRHTHFSVLSTTTRDDLVARGISPDRIHVIYAGIDLQAYPLRPGGHVPPGPVVTYLGRIKRYKGIDLVMRALPELRRTIPAVRYRIVGEGDFLPSLRSLAVELGVSDAVEFLGYQEGAAKQETLHGTRVLVYTSPKEGWGLSVIEAGAVGVPSIASDSPGLRESVRHGETGLLVPHGDISALTRALHALLTDDARWSALSMGARAWAERFSWDRMAEETSRLIERAMTEGGHEAVVRA
jgi:glycosyltransferase involved in cell wall biosynthesis